jgi:hypothetical protein
LEVKLVGILSLKPEDEKSLHPEALKWFNARRAEIQFEVPLEELSDDDLDTFLSDDEKREFIRCKDEIARGLVTCINMDEVSNDPVINVTIGLSLLKFQVDSLLPMHRIGSLLKNVHQRKVAKAEQEQRERDEKDKRSREQAEAERRRKEEGEKWQAARKAVNPPLNDAKRYLNNEEYDKFTQAALDTIEVYLEKGEEHLDDVRTFDYRRCLKKINDRREKERLIIAAKLRAQEYNQYLSKEKARLKALLCPNRKDHERYFKKQIKDRRYAGQTFAQFLSSKEEQDFDKTIVNISRKKLDEIVSSDFRQFIDSKCWRSYFLLPSTEYSLEGVPCLDFMFDVFAVVETRVWLKPGQKKFGDYVFDLPWREEKGYSVLLQEPEFLGYHYLMLTPEDLGGYVFWQSTPLVLLKRLLNGDTKPGGFTITAAADGMITYKIPKFSEEVNIPDDFTNYLKSIGSIDEMVSMGIMTQRIASIAKSESAELGIEQKASLSEGRGRNSKKARAFQLFSQGKGPSSPEVKTLGLHKSTRFKYYNQYLAIHKP